MGNRDEKTAKPAPSGEVPMPEPKYLAKRAQSGEWLELADADDWTAGMWAHGTDPVFTQEQLRAYADARVVAATKALKDWRFEVCERLGLSCAAGAEWSPDQIWQHVTDVEIALNQRAESAERERDQAIRREETAWRRANIAEAAVHGWESTMVIANLPMRIVAVDGWGPGEGEQVAIPALTPEKLTEILDRLAAKERELEALRKDAERYRFLRNPGNAIVYALDTANWNRAPHSNKCHYRYETPGQLDAAIDAAIAAERENQQ